MDLLNLNIEQKPIFTTDADPLYFHYKVILSYQGTAYRGLQWQKDTQQTIQQIVEDQLEILCKSPHVKTFWTSRTDAGVHALTQVARFQLPRAFAAEILRKGLNYLLPIDIRLVHVEECAANFQPRAAAKCKEYLYLFSNESYVTTAFASTLIANVPYRLDYTLMKKACEQFPGTHDFCNFYNGSLASKTTVRTLYECQLITHLNTGVLGELWYPYPIHAFRFVGRGFLKQMVRLLVGHLWFIGRGKLAPEITSQALQSPPHFRRKLGLAAPAHGLYLKSIREIFPSDKESSLEVTSI